MDEFSPGICKVLEASIFSYEKNKSIDITAMIGRVAFTQSIYSAAWLGSVTVLDTIGLLENFPLRGEEDFHLKLEAADLEFVVELKTRIYKIGNVETLEANKGLTYTIEFVSKTTYDASTRRVITSYKDQTGSSIIESLFKRYFSDFKTSTNINGKELPYNTKQYSLNGEHNKGRKLYVQPTNGKLRVVIPNYTADKAMKFITLKSYSATTTSSSFRFFETFEGYFFGTEEFLIKYAIDNKNVIEMFYDAYVVLNPKTVEQQVRTIETLSNNKRVDVPSDIHNGGYMNTVIEVDYVRRKVNELVFDYSNDAKFIDSAGKVTKISPDMHSEKFIADTFTKENSMRMMVFKDYSQEGDIPGNLRGDQHYNEIASRRIAHQHHINEVGVTIGLKGRLDIAAGNLIFINASKFSGNKIKEPNNKLSGNYLVATVTHVVDKGILQTVASLIKFSWYNVEIINEWNWHRNS